MLNITVAKNLSLKFKEQNIPDKIFIIRFAVVKKNK
jgi:hypothetical protein